MLTNNISRMLMILFLIPPNRPHSVSIFCRSCNIFSEILDYIRERQV